MPRSERALSMDRTKDVRRHWRALAFAWTVLLAFTAGGIPWYTLRAFPLVSLGAATVNVLDVLVALAIGTGVVSLTRLPRRIDPLALWPTLFSTYMVIPLVAGLLRLEDAPFAVREMRPLAFYLLAPLLVLLRLDRGHYRVLLGAWLAGAMLGVSLSLAHVSAAMPLPGYVSPPPAPAEYARIHSLSWNEYVPLAPTIAVSGVGFRLQYLEWTAVLVGALIATAGVVGGRRFVVRAISAVALAGLAWYELAAGARALQLVSAVAIVALVSVLVPRRVLIRGAAGALILAALAWLFFSSGGSRYVPTWLRVPVATSFSRWIEAREDRSLRVRTAEVVLGLSAVRRSPVFGLGLGSATPVPAEADPSGTARNVASGYAFLLFKTGIIGLVLYLGFMGTLIVRAWRLARGTSATGDLALLARICIGGVLSLLVLNLVHRVVDIPEGAIATALFAGIAALPKREEEP